MGNILKLEGKFIGVYQNEQGFFARFKIGETEIHIICNSDTFHKAKFGKATLTLEVNE